MYLESAFSYGFINDLGESEILFGDLNNSIIDLTYS